jgi:hypothetical protein
MLASIEEDQTPALAASLGGRAVGSGSALLSEEQAGAIIQKRNLRKRSSSEVEEKKKGIPSDVELEDSSIARRKVIKIQTNNHDTAEKKLMRGMESEEVGLVPVSQQAQVPVPVTSGTLLSPQFAQSIVRREDTNYIYCSEPQNVFTEELVYFSPSLLPLFSPLLPYSFSPLSSQWSNTSKGCTRPSDQPTFDQSSYAS